MTDTEFSKLAMLIKSLFPKEKDMFNDDSTMEAWFLILQSLDFSDAVKAVQVHAKTNKFAPSIAEIFELCEQENQVSWQELYEDAIRTIARYGIWNEEKGMNALDDISRKIVKRIGYKRICNSQEHDPYIRKEFKEAFEDVKQIKRLEITGDDLKCLT